MEGWDGDFFADEIVSNMKEDTFKTLCRGSCKGRTEHTVLEEFLEPKQLWLNEDDEFENSGINEGESEDNLYQIVQCRGCKAIAFRHLRKDIRANKNIS